MSSSSADYLEVIQSEAKKGCKGSLSHREKYASDLDLFEQATLSSEQIHQYPFSCFGGIYNSKTNKLLTVCCLVSRNKAISSYHKIFAAACEEQEQQQQLTFSVQNNKEFKSIDASVEYDMAVIELSANLGDSLGYLGLLANAKSDDFDIQSAQKPIILTTYDSAKATIEYHTTLAMDVTYNYLTLFNVISADAIAIVHDDLYGYAVVGVSSKTTLRQTVINMLNHEKFDTIHEWIAFDAKDSPIISKARKYLENKHKLQSKLIVSNVDYEREEGRAHSRGVQSIVRVNNNCFASICYDGFLKIWNWKTGEQLVVLTLPEEQQPPSFNRTRCMVGLEVSGELLLCLTSTSLVYYNWLTRRLEGEVFAGNAMESGKYSFTCMTCLKNDLDIMVGSTDSKIYWFRYSQSEGKYVFQRILIDFSMQVEQGITSILEVSVDLLLIGFACGNIIFINVTDVESSKMILVESADENTQVNKMLHFAEINRIAVILLNKIQVYEVVYADQEGEQVTFVESFKGTGSGEQAVVSVGFMKGYLDTTEEIKTSNSSKSKHSSLAAKTSIKELVLKREFQAKGDILAACAINEQEIGVSWDNSVQIVNIIEGKKDQFTKDGDDIVAISMLNSEGFITGDASGKVRAWIIGFSSPVLQPEQIDASIVPLNLLERIEEMSEQSEDKSPPQQSHRSMSQDVEEVLVHSGQIIESGQQTGKERFKKIDLQNGEPEDVFEAFKKKMIMNGTGGQPRGSQHIIKQEEEEKDAREIQVMIWKLERSDKENAALRAEKVNLLKKISDAEELTVQFRDMLQVVEQLQQELKGKNAKADADELQIRQQENDIQQYQNENENLRRDKQLLQQQVVSLQRDLQKELTKVAADFQKKEESLNESLMSLQAEISRLNQQNNDKDSLIEQLRREQANATLNTSVSVCQPSVIKQELISNKPSIDIKPARYSDTFVNSFDNFSKQPIGSVVSYPIEMLPVTSGIQIESTRRRAPNATPKMHLQIHTTPPATSRLQQLPSSSNFLDGSTLRVQPIQLTSHSKSSIKYDHQESISDQLTQQMINQSRIIPKRHLLQADAHPQELTSRTLVRQLLHSHSPSVNLSTSESVFTKKTPAHQSFTSSFQVSQPIPSILKSSDRNTYSPAPAFFKPLETSPISIPRIYNKSEKPLQIDQLNTSSFSITAINRVEETNSSTPFLQLQHTPQKRNPSPLSVQFSATKTLSIPSAIKQPITYSPIQYVHKQPIHGQSRLLLGTQPSTYRASAQLTPPRASLNSSINYYQHMMN